MGVNGFFAKKMLNLFLPGNALTSAYVAPGSAEYRSDDGFVFNRICLHNIFRS